MDQIQSHLDNLITPSRLLESSFYQAWSAGTLSQEMLAVYAREYGALIALLPQGWSVQDDSETAHEEEEHIELWEKFADALKTKVGELETPEMIELVDTAKSLFSSPESALGALYAFEVQQPETATSKLEGLRKYYKLPVEVEPYFETHSHNHHEAEKLLRRIGDLSPAKREIAFRACKKMAEALRKGLDGIYDRRAQDKVAANC